MPHLVLEIGCEELPAHSIRRAAEWLSAELAKELRGPKLIADDYEIRIACTPRRLIVGVDGVAIKEPDEVVEKRGPSVRAAFDSEGRPTKALEGFCKSSGAEISQVEVRDEYVWIRADVKGKAAHDVLATILPKVIAGIPFDKTMRWGRWRMRFARPIRWILAVFNRSVVPLVLESVESGNRSRGHRFLCPAEFEAHSFVELVEGLRERFVEAEPSKREATIRKETTEKSGGRALLTDELVEENVFLTEWPRAIIGEFHEDFLSLPRPVLVTAMAKYERFLPIEDESGAITNRFVSIMNAGDEGAVRRGNEWVLNARFNDALFFYEEDSRTQLEEFSERTSRILFQEKLGSVRQRGDRIAMIAGLICKRAGFSEIGIKSCVTAARLCKADLSTGLVSELPSLQGVVGGEYARREGYAVEIFEGISMHYDPDYTPSMLGAKIGLIVMCADQSDRLAGYLGIGEMPKGSSDPFALRKAVTMLVQAQIGWNAQMNSIHDWILAAADAYRKQGFAISSDEEILEALDSILEGRYKAMFAEIPYDAMDATWSANHRQPARKFIERAKAVAQLSSDISFVRTARRPINIVSAAALKKIEFDSGKRLQDVERALFEDDAESRLVEAAMRVEPKILALDEASNFGPMGEALRELSAPIDAYFDAVMVMTDDEKRRQNRLETLAGVARLFLLLGDFSKIVIEGE